MNPILEIFLVVCTCLFLLSITYCIYSVTMEVRDRMMYNYLLSQLYEVNAHLDEVSAIEVMPKEEVMILLEKIVRREWIDWAKWRELGTFEEE